MMETHDVVLEILPLKDQKWVDHHRINKLADKLELDNIEAKIYFLRELSSIVRKLPLNIYQDPDDRLRLVEAVQKSLDQAIEEEEALWEAEAEKG